MKSAVFYGKHDVRMVEAEKPVPAQGELLVKVMACGVCGTDVHIFEGDKGAADCTPPTILGHEFAGIVEEVGSDVTDFRPGDRVCVDPNDVCGACDACRSGRAQFCTAIRGIGTTVNGGFAQYCAVPAKQAYRLSDGTSFEQGAMAEPLACCLHGIDMCDIRPGHSVMVIGGGMIGLLMVQLARLSGAASVTLLEPVEGKRDQGRRLGADLCLDPLKQDVPQELRRNGIRRIDCVIECAGLPSTIAQAIEYASHQSTVMMFGLTKPDETVSIRPFDIFRKEVVLKASFINPYTQGRAVELINSGRIDVSSMVYEVCPLQRLPEILSDASLRAHGKFIIAPWQESEC